MKNTSGFKEHLIFFVALLLSCAIFFAGCSKDIGTNSSSAHSVSSTQVPPITPVGAQPVCLTINPPSLVKLADKNYKLEDEIDNCGGKDASPLKVTLQIGTQTINLLGPATIPAKGKSTFSSQTSGTGQEIHFTSRSSSTAITTILATINNSLQGEWDGDVAIPH